MSCSLYIMNVDNRYSFIHHMEKRLMSKCTTEEKEKTIKYLCRCMMTSPEEWARTYAAKRDCSEEMEETCLELREQGLLM